VTAYTWGAVPFRSDAQRKYLWANHPEVAREFADHTPKDVTLPEHVKHARASGAIAALERFGLKRAGEELRLKIPDRTFHGFDAAGKTVAAKGHAKKANEYGDRRSSEDLARMLQALDEPPQPGAPVAAKNPLDRSTNWGPPSSTAAGDAGGRSGVGPSAFGGV
jgi:hypothetical protein